MGWTTSYEDFQKSGGKYQAGGSDIDLIPDNTDLVAVIDEVTRDCYNGVNTIKMRFTVLEPEAYSNRKVWKSLYMFEHSTFVLEKQGVEAAERKKKKDTAMFEAIDFNAGGECRSSGCEPEELTTEQLQGALMDKRMLLKMGIVTDKHDPNKKTQYIKAVAPAAKYHEAGDKPQSAKPAVRQPVNIGDDVPF